MYCIQLDLGREYRGGQRQVFYLARYLDTLAGYEPVIVAPKGAPLLEKAREAGISTIDLPGKREWSIGNLRSLSALVSAGSGIHLVNTHCARSAALASLVRQFSRARFKLVHTRRVSYPLSGWWSREKYRTGDLVVCVSGEIADVMEASGVERDKLRVIHSGIDTSLYPRKEEPTNPFTIGFLGALTPQKGCSVFLDALALLRREHPESWHGVVVGDGKLRDSLEAQARKLGLTSQLTFTGFHESREVMPRFDVLAVPSVDGEGSSGVIKEAWACGVPVVASDLPSNLELVTPDHNGLCVRTGDPQDLARALGLLLQESGKDNANRLVQAGFRTVQQFTDKAMASAYADLYQELYPRKDIQELFDMEQ